MARDAHVSGPDVRSMKPRPESVRMPDLSTRLAPFSQRLQCSSFLGMTYFWLRDYNILPTKELLLSLWVKTLQVTLTRACWPQLTCPKCPCTSVVYAYIGLQRPSICLLAGLCMYHIYICTYTSMYIHVHTCTQTLGYKAGSARPTSLSASCGCSTRSVSTPRSYMSFSVRTTSPQEPKSTGRG